MPLSPGQGGDITLRRVGAHKITVDPTGTPKTVGFTQGTLAITITINTREVLVAEYGTSPADIEITGAKVMAKWTMIESSLKTLDIALGASKPANYGNNAVLSRGVGTSGIQRAQDYTVDGADVPGVGKEILLHPLIEGSNTVRDITLWKCVITPTGDWELSDQGDMLIAVQAETVVNIAGTDGQLLALINEANVGA